MTFKPADELIVNIGGGSVRVWLVDGGAVAQVPRSPVKFVIAPDKLAWLIMTHGKRLRIGARNGRR